MNENSNSGRSMENNQLMKKLKESQASTSITLQENINSVGIKKFS